MTKFLMICMQLNKTVHHVYVLTQNLENYINKYLKNAIQEDASNRSFLLQNK